MSAAPDRLSPEFRVRVADADLPSEAVADLRRVSVTQDVEAPGVFALELWNWDPDRNEMSWSDADLFAEGQAVEIQFGYRDALAKVATGEITSIELVIRASEPPRLVVRGYDRSHRLRRSLQTRTYTGVTDADIAQRIAERASLESVTEATSPRFDYVVQRDQTDLDFLRARARAIGFEVVVDDRTLHYRARRHGGDAVATLSREVDLLAFSPRTRCDGLVGSTAVGAWDRRRKAAIVGRAAAGDIERMGGRELGPAAAARAFGPAENWVDGAVSDQQHADAVARARLEDAALSYVGGEGLCAGRADVRAGTVVELVGLGRRFSGLYYVTRAAHTYDLAEGYRTRFAVRRNAT